MREVFVFGSTMPGAPFKKRRLDEKTAANAHITLQKLMVALLDVEETLDVDLNQLYKMRTNGTPPKNEAEALETWPSIKLMEIFKQFLIEDQYKTQFVNLFSIVKKDEAFVFSHMGGFFNFRNTGGEFSLGGEPEWLQLKSLPKTIMQAAKDHFGVIEIVDCANPGRKQIAGKQELEHQLPIRLHKFLTTEKDFKDCSYYAKFGFEHVEDVEGFENVWEQMNILMKLKFEDMRTQYARIRSDLDQSADEEYTFKDLKGVRLKLNYDEASSSSGTRS